ncbi:MAG: pyridoxal phosphate-dependent aminotransferase [Candidatus Omnitrophica bacterium]|nr:pyridoxal phosphate-dependent aminotransferase [Candidatus Omnitrophota bacterium]
MNIKLSQRIINLAPSATLAAGRKAKELQAQGVKVLNLSVGEPDFPAPIEAKEAVVAAVRDNFSQYTDSRGIVPLREAICRRFREDTGLVYGINQVVVSCGSKHTLYNLFQSLLDSGDEVLVPVPYWTSYPEMVKLAGGVPVFVPGGTDLKVKPENLERFFTDKTRCLIINSPNNPSGVVYTKKELEDIARWVQDKGILVISDDAYQHFIYDEQSFCSIAGLPGMEERTIIVGAASKTYAMTGWRIGWFLGSQELADACAKLQDQSTSNPCSLSQMAALAALSGNQQSVQEMRRAFQNRRDLLLKILFPVKGISFPFPAGAFYLFFTHPAIKDSVDFASRFLEEAQVALVPGKAFGMEGYLRLSYAVSEEVLAEAGNRLAAYLSKT